MTYAMTIVNLLKLAMEGRNVMFLHDIYKFALVEFQKAGRIPPENFEAEVRQTLQSHCSSSKRFLGKGDFFKHHGRGLWSCNYKTSDLSTLL